MSAVQEFTSVVRFAGAVDGTMNKAVEAVEKKLSGISPKAIKVAGVVTAIGAAGIAATKDLAELGTKYTTAMNDLQAKTGLPKKEMQELGNIVKDVYGNNFGEDIGEVSEGVASIKTITKATKDELQGLTESGFALRDTFGYEIPESARAAKAMMDNFNIGGEKAISMIAAGAQNGLDYSNELLDSVSEYSVQFAKVGLDADDMFKIFQEGADSGAWNLDKVGDAVKEFSIRSIDGSNASMEAYKAIGVNGKEMMKTFAKGGPGAEKAFNDVINKLVEMDDEVARDAAGVGLFGTMWEDLGIDAVKSLANTKDGAYDVKNAMEGIKEVKYNDLGSAMEGIKREAEVFLLPIAATVANTLMKIKPPVKEFFGWVSSHGPQIGAVITAIASAFTGFKAAGLVTMAMSAMKGYTIATKAAAVGQKLLNLAMSANPIFLVITAVTTLVGVFIYLWKTSEGFRNFFTGAWDSIKNSVMSTYQSVKPVITAIGNAFKFGIGVAIGYIKAQIASLKMIFSGIVNFISGVFSGNWKKAWAGVRQIFGGIIKGIANMFKLPINAIISGINKFTGSLSKIKIPDWVPAVGGKGINIPPIPKLAKGGFTEGVSIAGEAGQEAVISFDPRYRKQNMAYWTQAGRMLGATDGGSFNLSGTGGGRTISLGGVTFAPKLNIQGGTDPADILAMMEAVFPEFVDMLKQHLLEEERLSYG